MNTTKLKTRLAKKYNYSYFRQIGFHNWFTKETKWLTDDIIKSIQTEMNDNWINIHMSKKKDTNIRESVFIPRTLKASLTFDSLADLKALHGFPIIDYVHTGIMK